MTNAIGTIKPCAAMTKKVDRKSPGLGGIGGMLAIAALPIAAIGGEGFWNYVVGGGASWQTAADWSDAANWSDDGVKAPDSPDDTASFTNGCNGVRYVRLPESGVTLRYHTANGLREVRAETAERPDGSRRLLVRRGDMPPGATHLDVLPDFARGAERRTTNQTGLETRAKPHPASDAVQ